MRKLILKPISLLTLIILNIKAFAQDKGLDIDVDINKDEGEWFNKPWVWVVGAAVFILLLAAILRGGNKK